jgi:hypothetical protein
VRNKKRVAKTMTCLYEASTSEFDERGWAKTLH